MITISTTDISGKEIKDLDFLCSKHVKLVVLDCARLEHDRGGNYEKTADVMTSPGANGRS